MKNHENNQEQIQTNSTTLNKISEKQSCLKTENNNIRKTMNNHYRGSAKPKTNGINGTNGATSK